jgi:hypothetical protein
LATAVGWIVCALVNLGAGRIVAGLTDSLAGLAGYYVSIVVISVLGAAVIGTAQWMFLRKRVYRASRWVWATAMSWGVGWVLTWGVRSSPLWRMISKPGAFTPFFATVAVAVGIAVGVTTGYVLNLLLRHPISTHLEPQQETSNG